MVAVVIGLAVFAFISTSTYYNGNRKSCMTPGTLLLEYTKVMHDFEIESSRIFLSPIPYMLSHILLISHMLAKSL